MALMKSKNVPKDAVVLDENEAMRYVWDLVSMWKPASDTWALRYGGTILGGINALSGVIINTHFRKKLKLGSYGHFASVIPICVMPGLLTTLFHRHVIATEILLMNSPQCPICYELRSAVIQLTMGIAYPMILAPNAALMLGNRYNTARIPHMNEGFKVMYNFLIKITKPFTGTLVFLAATQLIASSMITYFEISNHNIIRIKTMEIEKEILAAE